MDHERNAAHERKQQETWLHELADEHGPAYHKQPTDGSGRQKTLAQGTVEPGMGPFVKYWPL